MKKRQNIPKVREQASTQYYRATSHDPQKSARDLYADSAAPRPQRKISYIAGGKVREEPTEMPRLFIQGFGGSIKMDLRGVGVGLSEASFAYRVPDENLKLLHIHRGDIAVVDPMRPLFKSGNLILFGLDGREVLGRLECKKRVWWMNLMDDALPRRMIIIDQPLYGVVVGVFRLFTKIAPVAYRGTEANFKMPAERSGSSVQASKRPRGTEVKTVCPSVRYTKKKHSPFVLVSEPKSPFCLSELD